MPCRRLRDSQNLGDGIRSQRLDGFVQNVSLAIRGLITLPEVSHQWRTPVAPDLLMRTGDDHSGRMVLEIQLTAQTCGLAASNISVIADKGELLIKEVFQDVNFTMHRGFTSCKL